MYKKILVLFICGFLFFLQSSIAEPEWYKSDMIITERALCYSTNGKDPLFFLPAGTVVTPIGKLYRKDGSIRYCVTLANGREVVIEANVLEPYGPQKNDKAEVRIASPLFTLEDHQPFDTVEKGTMVTFVDKDYDSEGTLWYKVKLPDGSTCAMRAASFAHDTLSMYEVPYASKTSQTNNEKVQNRYSVGISFFLPYAWLEYTDMFQYSSGLRGAHHQDFIDMLESISFFNDDNISESYFDFDFGSVFCKHCGLQIDEDSNYCRFCGGQQTDRIKEAP